MTTNIQVLNHFEENVFFKGYSEKLLAKRLQTRRALWIKAVYIKKSYR